MTSAHPNITITDTSLTKEDIERFYTKAHAGVWELILTAERAGEMPPPIFSVVSLSAHCGEHTMQARGWRQVEAGWAELYPEEDAALRRELPEDPDLLEALAGAPLHIEGVDVVETRTAVSGALGVADLIRVMRDEHVGRPSTYASHVEAMFKCVDLGWLFLDDAGRFRVAEAGRTLLEVLADPSLPRLDKSYTAELEADLDAIERGEASPAQVLARHLGRLPGVDVDVPSDALESMSEGAEPAGPTGDPIHPRPTANTVSLPAEIDPEVVLAPTHPLRVVRRAFDRTITNAFGRAHPNRAEARRRRACRALALGEVNGDLPPEGLLERLQLDLGWRWVVGLAPNDPVWSAQVLRELADGGRELVDKLVRAAKDSARQTQRGNAQRAAAEQ